MGSLSLSQKSETLCFSLQRRTSDHKSCCSESTSLTLGRGHSKALCGQERSRCSSSSWAKLLPSYCWSIGRGQCWERARTSLAFPPCWPAAHMGIILMPSWFPSLEQYLGLFVSQVSKCPAQTCPWPWRFPPSLCTSGSSRMGSCTPLAAPRPQMCLHRPQHTSLHHAQLWWSLQRHEGYHNYTLFLSQKRWISALYHTVSPASLNCSAPPEWATNIPYYV